MVKVIILFEIILEHWNRNQNVFVFGSFFYSIEPDNIWHKFSYQRENEAKMETKMIWFHVLFPKSAMFHEKKRRASSHICWNKKSETAFRPLYYLDMFPILGFPINAKCVAKCKMKKKIIHSNQTYFHSVGINYDAEWSQQANYFQIAPTHFSIDMVELRRLNKPSAQSA